MTKNKTINTLLEILGCFISAAGIYSFAVAAEVPVTGIAGICAILYRLFGLPMGLSNVIINIPIIFFSYKLLGRSFLLRSLRCMILFAVFTDYLLPVMPVYTGNRLLATICGGVVGGIGDALIYMQNSSTGGIDFITMAIKAKHPHLPFGNLTFAAALAVILLNGAVFHDVDSIIYGLMFNFIVAAVINAILHPDEQHPVRRVFCRSRRPHPPPGGHLAAGVQGSPGDGHGHHGHHLPPVPGRRGLQHGPHPADYQPPAPHRRPAADGAGLAAV